MRRALLDVMQKNAGSIDGVVWRIEIPRVMRLSSTWRGATSTARARVRPALESAQRAYLGLQTVEALETLALAFLAAGQVRGHARYEELLKKTPFGFEAQEIWFQSHLTLGRLYERQDRRNDARRLYTSLLDRWTTADRTLADDRRARPPREVAVTTAAKTCRHFLRHS